MKHLRFLAIFFILFLLSGCVTIPNTQGPEEQTKVIDQLIKGMTLDEKIWQMFFVTPEDAAVLAVEAGIDMLLMTPDIDVAFKPIKDAVVSGRIPESRIEESVRRILSLKQERGNLY